MFLTKAAPVLYVICALLEVSALSQNTPSAKSGPSLKVTSDWLGVTLAQYGGGCYNNSYKERIAEASINNACIFTYRHVLIDIQKRKEDRSTSRYGSVPLGAVTEVEVSGSTSEECGHEIEIHINTGKLTAAHSEDGYATTLISLHIGNQPPSLPGAPLLDNPEQMAARIQKAFQHAVDLCRGTYTPPVQTIQPF